MLTPEQRRRARRAIEKRYRDFHPEYKAKIAARVKAWKKAHPEKVSAEARKRYCADKNRISAVQKKWAEANKERISAAGKKRYDAKLRADNKERRKPPDAEKKAKLIARRAASMKKWRVANKARRKAYKKQWEAANPAKHRDGKKRRNARWVAKHESARVSRRRSVAKWAANNPERAAVIKARAHVKRKASFRDIGTYSPDEWNTLLDETGRQCVGCGVTEAKAIYRFPKKGEPLTGRLTADHIIPLSKGGRGTIDNIQPLCLTCNTHKHDRSTNYLKGNRRT